MSDLYLGAYWPARKEPLEACADRLLRFLSGLAALDPAFASWYELGSSRRQALQRPIDFQNKDVLVKLLLRGRDRTDIGKHVMEDLGFSVHAWNGCDPPRAAFVRIECGLYTTVGLSNVTLLEPPEQLDGLCESARMAQVLALTARSWEPDWSSVISRQLRDARKVPVGNPVIDRLTYVSAKLAPNPNVPPACALDRIDAIGWLIVIQREPIDTENPELLERVMAVEAGLGLNSGLP